MFNSLRWRIAIPFILLISISLISMGIYLANFAADSYLETLRINTTNEAFLLSESLSPLLVEGVNTYNLDYRAKHWADLLQKRVTIIAANGEVIGESHEYLNIMDNHLFRPEIQLASTEGNGSSIRFSQTLEQRMLYVAVPILDMENIIGYIRLALPINEVTNQINHIRGSLIAVVSIAIIVTILLSIWITRNIIKPIQELTIFATSVTGSQPINENKQGGSEIDLLTNSINQITSQLHNQIRELGVERGRMAAVLGEMTDGVVIIDNQGLVQLINPAAEKIFKVDRNSAEGRSLIGVLRNHQLNELWRESYRSNKPKSASIELSNPVIYLQVVSTPLGEALPGSTLLLFQDVTQIRQLETIRKDFISNISHELRTPLASLKALSETLQEGALEDPPAAQVFLQRIDTEVDSLNLMVSELLELSRIESGRVPLLISKIHPCILLGKAIDRLRLQAERSGLNVDIKCQNDLPEINVDEKRLEQVLVNLLHNAIKFTPSGGLIIASADIVKDRIVFSVKDTGIGVPPEDLMRIFERFYKADRSRSSTGTGLGLAIARHLVEAHGGYIWAESTVGSGSTFSFSIPITRNIRISKNV